VGQVFSRTVATLHQLVGDQATGTEDDDGAFVQVADL
jgi:hypothetical protein